MTLIPSYLVTSIFCRKGILLFGVWDGISLVLRSSITGKILVDLQLSIMLMAMW